MNLDNKRFVTVSNEHGTSSSETIFHYRQKGRVITGSYQGGLIAQGQIIGKQTGENEIALLYQCLTTEGDLRTGESEGIVIQEDNGKLRITFNWRWLNGDQSGGTSEYIQLV